MDKESKHQLDHHEAVGAVLPAPDLERLGAEPHRFRLLPLGLLDLRDHGERDVGLERLVRLDLLPPAVDGLDQASVERLERDVPERARHRVVDDVPRAGLEGTDVRHVDVERRKLGSHETNGRHDGLHGVGAGLADVKEGDVRRRLVRQRRVARGVDQPGRHAEEHAERRLRRRNSDLLEGEGLDLTEVPSDVGILDGGQQRLDEPEHLAGRLGERGPDLDQPVLEIQDEVEAGARIEVGREGLQGRAEEPEGGPGPSAERELGDGLARALLIPRHVYRVARPDGFCRRSIARAFFSRWRLWKSSAPVRAGIGTSPLVMRSGR